MLRARKSFLSSVSLPLLSSMALLCGCSNPMQTTTTTTTAATGAVTVSGTQLLRDGKPWMPHGFYQIPFEVSPAAFATKASFWQAAYDGYTPAEYTQMVTQGADSVRLQIAQNGADPQNAQYYNAQWLQKAIGAIQAARAAGLTVIVSIQDEAQTGETTQAPLPNAATQRVWQELAPVFGQDRGVLFEMYNEPYVGTVDVHQVPSAADWTQWQTAMNQTLAVIRGLGAQNVVVADGLQRAQQLQGAPALTDPLNQVVYGAHPYAVIASDQTAATWDQKFGTFAQTHPVLVSEWGIGYYCDANTPASVVAFFQYIQQRGIGMQIGIWDFANLNFASVRQGFPNAQFSGFFDASGTQLACFSANQGPGKTTESWYLNGTIPTAPL